MPIPTTCPQCSRQLRVPDELVGKRVKCPGCGTTFAVEAEDTPAEEPVPKTSKRSAPPPPPEDEPQDEEMDGDEEAAPRKKKRRSSSDSAPAGAKPGKVQGIAIMMLIGGIIAILLGLSLALSTCFIWIPGIYSVVMGILALIRATKLLGNDAHLEAPPKGIAIMMIINILNFDMINLVLGILILVFLGDDEVKNYFQGGQGK